MAATGHHSGVLALRLVAFGLGLLVVIGTASSVFLVLVVPRAHPSRLLRMIAIGLRRFFTRAGRHLDFEARDRLMAIYGPLSMVLLFVLWLVLMVVGFGLIMWWPAGGGFGHTFAIAGSSVFTLGVATAPGAGSETLEFVAAGFGLLVIALEIAYLPAFYAAFASRETEVTLLASRAGTPAWGPEILARHHWFGTTAELEGLYSTWERWAAGVSESHANYPPLMWLRSPVPSRSWLLALTAMLDAAALHDAASPGTAPRQARVFLMMGRDCLRALATTLRIPYEDDPLPTTPLRLTRAEFDAGLDRLHEVAYPVERSDDDIWRNFSGWRINYEALVDRLTVLVIPPPAPWLLYRPEIGEIRWPEVVNRTPDEPEGRPRSLGIGGGREAFEQSE